MNTLPEGEAVLREAVEAVARVLLGRVNAPEQAIYAAARDGLIAALPFLRRADTAAPVVKALEWGEVRQGWFVADSVLGTYSVQPSGNYFQPHVPGTVGPITYKRLSADEAKAAAQQDFETRIRSALSSPLASTAGAEGWTPDKCSHEPYHGRCVHCDLQFVSGYPALASPAVSSASQADRPACFENHHKYVGKCPYCHTKLPGIASQADTEETAR